MAGSLKISDTATAADADWGFIEDPDVMKAIDIATWKAVRAFDNAVRDDCRQDAMVWLCVRSELIAQYREEYSLDKFVKLLGSRIYNDALRDSLLRDQKLVPDGREALPLAGVM